MGAPEGATLDESGQWWWDGSEWQPVNDDPAQDWSEDDVVHEQWGDELFDENFDPAFAVGQVTFEPQPCRWDPNAPNGNVKVEYNIRNGNSSAITDVKIHWTVVDGDKTKTGDKAVSGSLAAGALSKTGTLSWPFKGPGTLDIQIKFNGGQDGDHDKFTL